MKAIIVVQDLRGIYDRCVLSEYVSDEAKARSIGEAVARRALPGNWYEVGFGGCAHSKFVRAKDKDEAYAIASCIARNSGDDSPVPWVKTRGPFAVTVMEDRGEDLAPVQVVEDRTSAETFKAIRKALDGEEVEIFSRFILAEVEGGDLGILDQATDEFRKFEEPEGAVEFVKQRVG